MQGHWNKLSTRKMHWYFPGSSHKAKFFRPWCSWKLANWFATTWNECSIVTKKIIFLQSHTKFAIWEKSDSEEFVNSKTNTTEVCTTRSEDYKIEHYHKWTVHKYFYENKFLGSLLSSEATRFLMSKTKLDFHYHFQHANNWSDTFQDALSTNNWLRRMTFGDWF